MTSFQHYEDLRCIFARMNKVLPGHIPPTGGEEEEEGWDWRSTVIEAKPVRLQRLAGVAGAVFQQEMPSMHQTSASRRWFVAEKTRVSTADWQMGSPTTLPAGVSLWHASDQARRLAVLAMHDAVDLFQAQTRECTLPANDEWRTCGRLVLFATPGPAELCFRDSLRLLAPHAPCLARLVNEYARSVAWMYGMCREYFDEACRLHITWHAPGTTSPACLAPASPCRYENGPIVRVSVGRSVVEHDLIPAISDPSCVGQEHPVRLEVSEGVMVCMDGPARMRYSHGHPRASEKAWFTLTFLLDCTRQSLAVGYDRETRSLIMATPLRKDRVVASTSPEPVPRGEGLGLDLMGVLVKDMRLRLRVAESYILSARHESPGLKSKSSSSILAE